MTLTDRVEPKALPHLALLNALQLKDHTELQDLLCSLILSECVYKAVDSSRDATIQAISSFASQFSQIGSVEISDVQFCQNRVTHKYLLATGGSPPALYVAFMGTKELRDVVADVALGAKTLFSFDENSNKGEDEEEENLESAAAAAPSATPEEAIVVAHGGFLSRAQGIPSSSLLLHALKQNMRLVLCGHSLGGAVATLVMLRLLSSLQQHLPALVRVRCITFGMPALGTRALGEHIDSQGWGQYFTNYALPADPVPRLHLPAKITRRNRSSGVKRGKEDVENEEELMETLFKEETSPTSSAAAETSSSGLSDTNLVKNVDQTDTTTTTTTAGVVFPRWASLREVARKAGGVLPRFTLPPFLSYAHFGMPLYLLPKGVSFSIKDQNQHLGDSSDTTVGAKARTPSPAPVTLPRGLLAAHRMPAYRSRLLEICQKYHNNAPVDLEENNMNSSSSSSAKRINAVFNLAPQIRIIRAETSLPIVYTTASRKQSKFTMRVRVQGEGLDTCTGASLRFPAAAGSGSSGSITAVARAVDVGRARQHTMESLNNFLASGSSSREKNSIAGEASDSGAGGGGRTLLQSLGNKLLHPFSGRNSNSTNGSTKKLLDAWLPEIEFVFEVPAEAILELQLVQQNSSALAATSTEFPASGSSFSASNVNFNFILPLLELNIFSDFAKVPVPVHCIPQTAWIVPLDTHLGDLVYKELAQAAQEDGAVGATAAAADRLQGKRKQKQEQKNTSQQLDDSGNPHNQENVEIEEGEEASQLSWREKFLRRLQLMPTTKVPSPPSSPPPPLRSMLYRGLLITDISNVLIDCDDSKLKLELVAQLLQWRTAADNNIDRSGTRREQNAVSKGDQADVWADVEMPFEDYEMDSLLQKDLSLGTRLKQQLHRMILPTATHTAASPPPPLQRQGGSSAEKRRKQELWQHLFNYLPPGSPDVVVILASGVNLKNKEELGKLDKDGGSVALQMNSGSSSNKINGTTAVSAAPNTGLASSTTSSEFNLDLLDAVHAVAVASSRCHAAALLAVAAPEAKDPAYRRRLSFSSGFYGRPGAVVPIDYDPEKEKEGQQPPSSLKTMMLQAALLAHASAVKIPTTERLEDGVKNKGKYSIKSILRAKL